MRSSWSAGLTVALLSQSLFALSAKAASFPDVPTSSLYRPAIESLADKNIIKGNPDGSFAPDKTVNRAEILTLLYRAFPHPLAARPAVSNCFLDVPAGSWFEQVVCDAAAQGFVAGYSDKTFRPNQAVNRVEALKMLFTVSGLPQQTTLEATTKALSYGDVSSTAWYMQYLSAAFKLKILPMPGADSAYFWPAGSLSRAEAAAYIYNAISPEPLSFETPSVAASSSSSVSSSSSSVPEAQSSAASSSSKIALMVPVVTQMNFPFTDTGKFTTKETHSYRFSLTQTTVAMFGVTVINENMQDDVQCRLYKLDSADSFALEYYFGYQGKDSCTIRTALAAGSYQLDVIPVVSRMNYTVTAKVVTGDGNDGFVQAKNLIINAPSSTNLDNDDYGDYYMMKLTQPMKLTVELTNESALRCIIYPMEDVDIYGFSGPECNASYDFPAGTYYIGVLQKNGRLSKKDYSVRYHK